jgi:hypothetical protein
MTSIEILKLTNKGLGRLEKTAKEGKDLSAVALCEIFSMLGEIASQIAEFNQQFSEFRHPRR